MFWNYLRVAYRHLIKQKGYAVINISGLAIGVACCILISLYVFHELSYDRFHEKADRIYRIKQTSISPNKEEAGATTPFKAGPMLEAEYPQYIEHSVRFFDMQEPTRTILNEKKDISFRENNFYFVDSTFFNVFSVELKRGNPEKALANPSSIVLTEEKAQKYFEEQNPIGKTLNLKGIQELTVTGIMEPIPGNSHIKADVLVSFSTLDEIYHNSPDYNESWFWNPIWTYVLLKENVSADQLEARFPRFVEKYYHKGRPEGETVELELQPITDIHLYSNLDSEMQPNNSIFYIYLFSTIAALILLIACINFVNLSTARSSQRSREVGMRKVLGADRTQLFKQFMGESFLMSFIAIVTAVLLVHITLPSFNSFFGKQLAFLSLQNEVVIIGLVALTIFVGLVSGIYPALYLSAFRPVQILQGQMSTGKKGTAFRKWLVVFQFALSVILIIGTLVVYLQLQHMQTQKLGFNKEQIAILPIKQNLIAWEFPTFREEVLRSPHVASVAGIGKILGSGEQTYYKYAPAGTSQGEESSMLGLYVTHDFIETFGIRILAGRSFSRDFPTDKDRAVLVNEKMLVKLDAETPEEAIGKTIYYYPADGERESYSVIGVVDNFHYTSIKKEIDPLVIRVVQDLRSILGHIEYAAVKLAPGGVSKGIEHIKSTWEEINYIEPFEYSFLDEELDKVFASEAKMGTVSGVFSGLAIFIACLGLLGLSSFTTSQRTKEIGIRKAMGATISSILYLLSREYVKLILIANIIAWPIIYYLSMKWLQDFPTHIPLNSNIVIVFLLSAVFSILICLFTVSYQSLKAALINPAETIREE